MTRTRVLISLLTLVFAAGAAAAPLDRTAVLRLARERAAELQVAEARQARARGALEAARTWRHNPELDLEAGSRRGPGGETWDRSVGLSQRLDLAGRGARIAAARAGSEAVARDRDATEVAVLGQAATLHLTALHARHRRELAAEAVDLHERLLEIARRRHEAGETGQLDVHQATVSTARARMALATANAAEREALTALASLLALDPDEPVAVTGELAWPGPPEADLVLAAAAAHPQLHELAARRRAAAARVRLAGAARWPEVGVAARVGREEEADIVKFGLSLGLPVFARGQGERAAATASERIAEVRLAAARKTRLDRSRGAWERQDALRAALASAETEAGPALAASSRLGEQSYRLGEIALDRVLLIERENLDARHHLNDLRLAAALAALEVAEIAALPPLAAQPEESR